MAFLADINILRDTNIITEEDKQRVVSSVEAILSLFASTCGISKVERMYGSNLLDTHSTKVIEYGNTIDSHEATKRTHVISSGQCLSINKGEQLPTSMIEEIVTNITRRCRSSGCIESIKYYAHAGLGKYTYVQGKYVVFVFHFMFHS